MNDLLDAWEEMGTQDERHLAYTLATSFHETGAKMQPVREGFKKSDRDARAYVQRNYGHKGRDWYCWPQGPFGQVYYGRGDVQLTWYDNYVKMGSLLGLPLAEKPDLVLQSKVSKRVLIEGMLRGASKRGDFTGKALEDYFNENTDDPVGARRIVNGTDRAKLIAGYHGEFLRAVREAVAAYERGARPDLDEAPARLPAKTDEVSWGGAASAVGGLAAGLGTLFEKIDTPLAILALLLVIGGVALVVKGRLKLVRETGE